MIEAEQLIPYKASSSDYEETERLKAQFKRLQRERQPLYLTSEEFEEILHWNYAGNTEDYKEYTKQIQKM